MTAKSAPQGYILEAGDADEVLVPDIWDRIDTDLGNSGVTAGDLFTSARQMANGAAVEALDEFLTAQGLFVELPAHVDITQPEGALNA